jgi:hypothetical protein
MKTKNFFSPLSDSLAIDELVKNKKYDESMAEKIAKSWREIATEIDGDYNGPIAWRVQAGFTLKKHVEKVGPCHWESGFLQDRLLVNDMPTQSSLTFFVPRLISKDKNVREQLDKLFAFRRKYNLPGYHLCSFGQAGMLCGLILEHYKRTGNCIFDCGEHSRTDTFALGVVSLSGRYSSSLRLTVGPFHYNDSEMDDKRLYCQPCSWSDNGRYPLLGCFPMGVDIL